MPGVIFSPERRPFGNRRYIIFLNFFIVRLQEIFAECGKNSDRVIDTYMYIHIREFHRDNIRKSCTKWRDEVRVCAITRTSAEHGAYDAGSQRSDAEFFFFEFAFFSLSLSFCLIYIIFIYFFFVKGTRGLEEVAFPVGNRTSFNDARV